MTRPDLDTDEGVAAYRRELKQVGRPLRFAGLALIVGAALLILSVREGYVGGGELTTNIGYGMLALGWASFIAATFLRTRHHRRRMAEGQ